MHCSMTSNCPGILGRLAIPMLRSIFSVRFLLSRPVCAGVLPIQQECSFQGSELTGQCEKKGQVMKFKR